MKNVKIGCLIFILFPIVVLVLAMNRCNQATDRVEAAAVKSEINENAQGTTEKNIPGVMPVDVYLNLEKDGFTTNKELNPCCNWISVKGDMSPIRYLAEVYGNSSNSFYRVNASVTTTIDKDTKAIAKPFFGYLATLNYTGSNPEKARKWVEKNIGKKVKTEIGGVVIELDHGQKNGLSLSLYKN